jgi:hypothetical protein
MIPEEIAAAEAPVVAEEIAPVEPEPSEVALEQEQVAAVETEIIAEETPIAQAAGPVAEGAPAETVTTGEAPVPLGPEQTFEQAWEEFEAEEGEEISPEEALKRKADRRKRQTLVFDETLGKVVAKRKRKGGRARGWEEEPE